jgi:hypothetical protein
MESLDCPDGAQSVPARNSSVGPLQAMAMLNDRFVVRMSEHFAERVSGAADPVGEAFRLALGRSPSEAEGRRLAEHAARHGLPDACRLILNLNEFMFLD